MYAKRVKDVKPIIDKSMGTNKPNIGGFIAII
jgi:hypothetical protein